MDCFELKREKTDKAINYMMILFPELINDLPAEASDSMRCFLNLTNLSSTHGDS